MYQWRNNGNSKIYCQQLKKKTEPDFDSANLKINTFYKKRNSENIEWEYISTPITPKFLKETKLNALNKAVLNFKDSNEVMHVKFESYQGETKEQKQSDYFDITEFSNEIEKGKLKNIPSKVEGNIFLRGERTNPYPESTEDKTDYPKASELLELIENPKLKDNIIVGSVQIAGKLNKLLPYLVKDISNTKKIQEEGDGIIFGDANGIPCEGDLWTGFDGYINNTKKQSTLKVNELKELCKRTKKNEVYIRNAIVENLDSKDSDQIQDIIFLKSKLANINFKDSNLSKIEINRAQIQGDLKFENTTLPKNMAYSITDNLILKNVTFPKEEFINNYEFAELSYSLPDIENSLEIYGEIKDSILKNATPEQLESLVPQKNMPKEYKGSEEIYNRLKKIFRGEAQIINGNPNPNYHGSIQKQQSQLLALLQTQNKSRG